jgi:hypothetical protein
MAVYSWTGLGSGDWAGPGNWSPIGVPGSADIVQDTLANSTITVSDFEQASTLIIDASGADLDLSTAGSTLLTESFIDTLGNIQVVNGAFLDSSGGMDLAVGTLSMLGSDAGVGFTELTLGVNFLIQGVGTIGDPDSTVVGAGTIDARAALGAGTELVIAGVVQPGVVLELQGPTSELSIQGSATSELGISVGFTQTLDVTGSLVIDSAETARGAITVEGGTIAADQGITLTASGSLTGYGTIDSNIVGPGSVNAIGGTLLLTDPSGAPAAYNIGGGTSALEFTGPVGSGSVITYLNPTVMNGAGSGALFINDPLQNGDFQGTLDNFANGDTLELQTNGDNVITHATYSAGVITFTDSNGDVLGTIASLTDPGTLTVLHHGEGVGGPLGGTLVEILASASVPCFLRGTAILTPHGEMPVELLEAGDHVTTLSGERKTIRWIGTGRTLVTPLNRDRCAPIVVRRGALAENVPHRDLFVTRGHSLFIDGYLVPAEELINHRSIAWVEETQVAEYYHVELDDHDVLVAEGAAAESYREDENHAQFHNSDSRPESYILAPCAEVLHYGPELKRIWQALSDRAGVESGMTITADPDLHLVVDGARIDAVSEEAGIFRFQVDGSPAEARIVSRSTIPSALGFGQDQRKLGVAVRKIVLSKGGLSLEIGWDGELTDGFNDPEPAEGYRWTRGDAVIPAQMLAPFKGGATVEIHVGGVSSYALPKQRTARAA